MTTSEPMLGRVLRSSITGFTFGFDQSNDRPPAFGLPVKTEIGDQYVYGLVTDQVVQDDSLVRQIVASAEAVSPERIQDLRLRRQVPIAVSVLTIGHGRPGALVYLLPPYAPDTLQPIYACSNDEIGELLQDFSYFRTVLNNMECPSEELLVASLRQGMAYQGTREAQQRYLRQAGRELVRLLANDNQRLDAILRRLAALYAD